MRLSPSIQPTNLRAWLAGFLALTVAGCTRVVYVNDYGGYRSGVDDRVSVQRSAEGSVAADLHEITLENQFGPLVVTGADEGFGWTWKGTCWGKDTDDAQAHADKWRIEAAVEGSRLHLRLAGDSNSRERRRFESELTVRVPRMASVEAHNSFGEVRVSALNGPATVRVQNGKVTLEQVRGIVKASTSFAAVEAEDVGAAELSNQNGALRARNVAGTLVARTSFAELNAESVQGNATLRNQNGAILAERIGGDLDAETSFTVLQVRGVEGAAQLRNQNGRVEAREVTGPLRAHTSFAGIELQGASPVFEAQNQNGAIHIVARSDTTERVDASTSFAPIEVQLPATAKPIIRAETTFGKINSDFPVLVWTSVSDKQFQDDPARPKVTLRARNADVHIRKLP